MMAWVQQGWGWGCQDLNPLLLINSKLRNKDNKECLAPVDRHPRHPLPPPNGLGVVQGRTRHKACNEPVSSSGLGCGSELDNYKLRLGSCVIIYIYVLLISQHNITLFTHCSHHTYCIYQKISLLFIQTHTCTHYPHIPNLIQSNLHSLALIISSHTSQLQPYFIDSICLLCL